MDVNSDSATPHHAASAEDDTMCVLETDAEVQPAAAAATSRFSAAAPDGDEEDLDFDEDPAGWEDLSNLPDLPAPGPSLADADDFLQGTGVAWRVTD